YKRRCYSLVPAKSDSLPHAYAHAQSFKSQTFNIKIVADEQECNWSESSRSFKFCNSNNHELLHHQRYSKSNNEVVFEEIVSLRSILWKIVSLDEEEEVASFQDKYEHVGQKHKLIKKVKSR
nr:hypothetical protein [Tanacetum cinerariifolium]